MALGDTKRIKHGEAGRAALTKGVFAASRLAGVTLGPNGARVMLDREFDYPEVTKDGFTAIRNLEHSDRFETLGAELIKACAKKTRDAVGDGSTTASLLAGAFCREGLRLIGAGYAPIDIRRCFERLTRTVRAELERQRMPASDVALLRTVATSATAGDSELAEIVAEAVHTVGTEGVINVSYHQGVDTTVDYMSGMEFDHGLLSRSFLLDPNESVVKLDQPYLLMCRGKVERAEQVIPALEAAKRDGRSLLVLAEDVSDQALAVMLTNHRARTVKCAPVKGPGSGIYRHDQTSDIALLTGGSLCGEDLGLSPETIRTSDLGRCKRVVVEGSCTTILGGVGDQAAVDERIAQLRDGIAREKKTYDRNKLKARLARLVSGVANIRVSGYTESAWRERQKRAENAVATARTALSGGVVAGSGVALVRAAQRLRETNDKIDPVSVAYMRVLEAPFRSIAERSGRQPSLLLEDVLASPETIGYDGARDALCDVVQSGVIDAREVVETALVNAVATASQLLMSDCIVALDKPPPKGVDPA